MGPPRFHTKPFCDEPIVSENGASVSVLIVACVLKPKDSTTPRYPPARAIHSLYLVGSTTIRKRQNTAALQNASESQHRSLVGRHTRPMRERIIGKGVSPASTFHSSGRHTNSRPTLSTWPSKNRTFRRGPASGSAGVFAAQGVFSTKGCS